MTQFGYHSFASSPAGQRIWAAGNAFAAKAEAHQRKLVWAREHQARLIREAAMAEAARQAEQCLYGRPSMHGIAREVARKHQIPWRVIRGRACDRQASHARQECYWRFRHECGASLMQIGRFFGRDHTTIISGLRAHAERTGATS